MPIFLTITIFLSGIIIAWLVITEGNSNVFYARLADKLVKTHLTHSNLLLSLEQS